MVRVEDVARVAGVSPITVSRTLRTPDLVKPETRERVSEAVRLTGYVVNSFASTLRSGLSPVIAVFASNLRHPHFANVMQGCSEALEGSGFQLMTARVGDSVEEQRRVVESIIPFRPAAMLFTDILKADSMRERLGEQGVPVMEMWDQRPDPIDMVVTISEHDAGRLLGEHLIAHGARRIAYVGQLFVRGRVRLAGFEAALAAHGLACEPVIAVQDGWAAEVGAQALEDILAQFADCDAVAFGTDVLAAGGLKLARQRGLRVPHDIAIAGFGDVPLAGFLEPGLTTVSVPSYEMGKMAGRMLGRRLRRETVEERRVVLPINLVGRESTARVA